MTAPGLPMLGSSSEPARTMIRCGRGSASLNRGVPQVGQKERRITAPLSAIEVKTRVSPVTRIASLLNTALTVPPPALKY